MKTWIALTTLSLSLSITSAAWAIPSARDIGLSIYNFVQKAGHGWQRARFWTKHPRLHHLDEFTIIRSVMPEGAITLRSAEHEVSQIWMRFTMPAPMEGNHLDHPFILTVFSESTGDTVKKGKQAQALVFQALKESGTQFSTFNELEAGIHSTTLFLTNADQFQAFMRALDDVILKSLVEGPAGH